MWAANVHNGSELDLRKLQNISSVAEDVPRVVESSQRRLG
jgi:hypothetical protein